MVPAPRDAPQRDRWRARAGLSAALRIGCGLVPLGGAVLTSAVAARVAPRPNGFWSQVGWFAVILALSTAVLLVLERVTRKALPLTVLLKLSLLFPDTAPSRFAIALRTGNTKRLAKWAEEVRQAGTPDDLSRAAETVVTLAAALNAHDRATRGHSERVRAFTDLLGEEMKLETAERDRLRWAGLLHDIGKLSVAVDVLNNPGQPSPDEWESLKRHPREGARIAAPLMGWLGPWGDAIAQHHERFDGAGYPAGLAGEDICLGGRIVCVADSYDTMTSARSYKRPYSVRAARTELATGAGTQFDPQIVRAFLNISLGRLRWVVGPLGWLAEIPILGLAPRAVLASFAGSAAVQAAVTAAALGVVIGGGGASGGGSHSHAHGTSTSLARPAVTSPPASRIVRPVGPAATAPGGVGSDGVPPGTVPVVPGVGVPGVSVPGVSVPGVSVPGVSVPGVSVPGVTIPGVTIPGVPTSIVPPGSVPTPTVPALPVPTAPTLPAPTVPLTLPNLPVPTVPTAPLPTVPVTTPPAPTIPHLP